ncbi:uncharacterized protein LOC131207718 [Anopheles bellator]|uniref:uncharacterized protein LOC131207718 n=1 Tax=Anopheles bellator TaxID=139047 RepID=UPI00264801A9|nr:uncharacterized protein LOC131207718 [Anopheles bellator]
MARIFTGIDLNSFWCWCCCCCNQRHLLAVIFIFSLAMGAPHTAKLQRATENPTFVFWYHEHSMVNFDQLNGFSVAPFQPSAPAIHQHLQHYLPHPVLDHGPQLSAEDQDFSGVLDDDDLLQRSLHLDQDATSPFLATSSSASSSSSLLLASLAAAAFSSSSYQNLEPAPDMSIELGPEAGPGLSSESSDPLDAGGARRHNHNHPHPHVHHHAHQHQHQHHHHHHFPRGAWPTNHSSLLLYSHILTPAPSVLTIRKVHFKHAGNYTCAPSNARPASITVHVLQDKKPAAMQHANRSQLDDGSKQSRNGCPRQGRHYRAFPVAALLLLCFTCHLATRPDRLER